jgi:hypothetical protein
LGGGKAGVDRWGFYEGLLWLVASFFMWVTLPLMCAQPVIQPTRDVLTYQTELISTQFSINKSGTLTNSLLLLVTKTVFSD